MTMFKYVTAALIALGASTAAHAASLPEDGITVDEAADVLVAHGYPANIVTTNGYTSIQSSVNGANFTMYFYDCAGERCRAIQFVSAYGRKAGMDDALLNAWNSANRYGRAYLNDEAAWVEVDLDVSGGSTAQIDRYTMIWETTLDRFKRHVGY